MSIVTLIIVLALIGSVCWMILQIPMPQPVRNIIIGVICIVMILWVLQAIGINTGLPRVKLN